MKKLKTILQSKFIITIITILCLTYSLLLMIFYPFHSHYSLDTKEIVGDVTKYTIDGQKLTIFLKAKEIIIINYYFKTKEEKIFFQQHLALGDKLKIKGQMKEPAHNTIPNLFDYKEYLRQQKIFYLLSATNIEKLENNTSLFYYLKNKITKRIDRIDKTGYLRTFILGDKCLLKNNIMIKYQENGVSHLLSISGMHLSLIIGIILFILSKLTYNNYYKYSIISLILLLYLFLTGFSASIIRASIMFLLSALDQCFHLQLKKLNLMLLTLDIAILMRPFILWEVGFQFSYIISFCLVVFSNKLSKSKNKVKASLYISYLCFLVSFPLCIYHFSQVNFLSILFNVFMIPIVSILIFPLTLIVFCFPILYPIYQVIISLFENLNILINNFDVLKITFMKPNLILVFLYYLLIILTIVKKQNIILIIIVLFIHKLYPYLSPQFICTIIDVGQGDSILIHLPYNKGNILIDTGGRVNREKELWAQVQNNSSITDMRTIPYLKSLGIDKLDYLIITHGDYDHIGEAINLTNKFKINNVIFNKGEYNTLETQFIKILKKKKFLI